MPPELSPALPDHSPNRTLTAEQHHTLSLIVEGRSLTEAAQAAGVHRNTVRNWRRTIPAFAREFDFAQQERALVWQEQAIQLAPQAAEVLHQILHDDAATPALRLRAALAVLKMASNLQPSSLPAITAPAIADEPIHLETEHGIVVHNTLVHNRIENDAQSGTTPTRRALPEPGRNALCPCGSALKYKRCCGSPLLAAAA